MSRATRRETVIPSVHLSIALPAGEQVTTIPAVSPDGRTIAYSAGRTLETSQLYLRALDSFSARAVHASEGAQYPFFSPDGQSVGFFAGGKMWRAPLAGGASQALAAASRSWGGSWCSDGTIVYAPTLGGGLWRVGQDGGTPLQLTKTDGGKAGYAHVYPQCLPGSDDILFAFFSGQTFYAAALSPSSGSWRQVTPARHNSGGAVITVYAASGHLLAGDGATGVTGGAWTPASTGAEEPGHRRDPERLLDHRQRASLVQRVGQRHRRLCTRQSAAAASGRGSIATERSHRCPESPTRSMRPPSRAMASASCATATRRSGSRIWPPARARASCRTCSRTARGWLPGSDRIVVSSNIEGDWDLYTVSASGGTMTSLLKKPLTQHPMSVAPDGSVIYLETHPEQRLRPLDPPGWRAAATARGDSVQRDGPRPRRGMARAWPTPPTSPAVSRCT